MLTNHIKSKKTCLTLVLMMYVASAYAQIFPIRENYVELGNQSFQTTIDLDDVDAFFDLAGINFSTNSLMESAFDQHQTFVNQLANSIKNKVLTEPKIESVSYSYVQAFPISLTFTQSNNGLTASLDGLGLYMLGEADGGSILCPSLDFEVRITNLEASLTYNFGTGLLQLSDISYDVESDADCSGLLGFIGNLFSDGKLADNVQDAIDDSLYSAESFLDTQELFSIADLADQVAVYSDGVSASNLPYKEEITEELDRVEDFLLRLYIDTGFQLEISLAQEHVYGRRGTLRRITNTLSLSTNAF